jgi:hypothetical protein
VAANADFLAKLTVGQAEHMAVLGPSSTPSTPPKAWAEGLARGGGSARWP